MFIIAAWEYNFDLQRICEHENTRESDDQRL